MVERLVETRDTFATDENGREKTRRVPEQDLIEEYFEIRDKLILHNLRLCFHIAKHFAWTQEDILDLFQAGVLGMLRAIDTIDPTKGTRFSTYASHWIKNYVRKTARDLRNIIRIPPDLYRLPTDERPRLIFSSLDGTAEGDCVGDLVDTSEITSASEMECLERYSLVQKLLMRLSNRQAEILRRRFGLDGHHRETLDEIGMSMNLTKERIRQLEQKALGRLRELSEGRKF